MKRLQVFILGLFLSITAGCSSNTDGADAPNIKAFLENSSKPAVMKFYAQWCVTCKEYAPTFEKAKEEFGDRIDFFSIDIDRPVNKNMVRELKIAHIPVTAFVTVDRGNISKQFGPLKYEDLKAKLESLL